MKVSPATVGLVVALAGGTGFAFVRDNSASASGSNGPTVARTQPVAGLESFEDEESDQTLPPDHPPVGANAAAGGDDVVPSALPLSLSWKVPPGWPSAPNPSSIRIATHTVPRAAGDAEDGELSVSRAGGDVEANIERWTDQFEGGGSPAQERRAMRREKTVGGFAITIVEVAGTYRGGMGAAGSPHPGWALFGAIVLAPEQPYFFKLTGPAATVHAARAGFETLVDSIAAATH